MAIFWKNGPVYCVFTIIGALWEFSSGSTGSSGIEVNPSKMDPWFPTPGSRMTVVFHKTPSNHWSGWVGEKVLMAPHHSPAEMNSLSKKDWLGGWIDWVGWLMG